MIAPVSFKKLLAGTIVVALAVAVVMILRVCGQGGLDALAGCANEIKDQIPSPDGKHWAVIYRRDCGATTGWDINVAVVGHRDPAASSLRPNAFSCQAADPSAIQVSWKDERQLVIRTGAQTPINSKERSVDLVRIRLEIQPSA
jgi:hypothetical protein